MKKRYKAAGMAGQTTLLFYLASEQYAVNNEWGGHMLIIAAIALNLIIAIKPLINHLSRNDNGKKEKND